MKQTSLEFGTSAKRTRQQKFLVETNRTPAWSPLVLLIVQ